MQLALSGASEIDAPVEKVWRHLMDYRFVADCAPGVRSAESVDPTHFRVVSGFAAGSAKLVFALDVALLDLDPEHSARITAHGKAAGSEVDVDTVVQLSPGGTGGTTLEWKADATFRGSVVSVGGRLLKPVTSRMTAQFWKKFAAAVGGKRRKKRR